MMVSIRIVTQRERRRGGYIVSFLLRRHRVQNGKKLISYEKHSKRNEIQQQLTLLIWRGNKLKYKPTWCWKRRGIHHTASCNSSGKVAK